MFEDRRLQGFLRETGCLDVSCHRTGVAIRRNSNDTVVSFGPQTSVKRASVNCVLPLPDGLTIIVLLGIRIMTKARKDERVHFF